MNCKGSPLFSPMKDRKCVSMKRQRNQSIIVLTLEQREELQKLMRKHFVTALYAKRARLILLLDEGKSITEAARLIEIERRHIYKWAYRYNNLGLQGLNDLKRPGRPKSKPLTAIETGNNHSLMSGSINPTYGVETDSKDLTKAG